MSITGDFDFIHAKVHGLRSRVYEFDRLATACDLRSVTNLWRRIYPQAEPGDHHDLQRRLLADQLDMLCGIRRHLPAALKPCFTWLLRRFQIENLKVLLRAWHARSPIDAVEPFLAPLPPDLALPNKAMVRAHSLADFLLLIPEPSLRQAGEANARYFIETEETFLIETPLDAAYHAGLFEAFGRLRGDHGRASLPLARLEVMIYNVLCLFRLKLNYGLAYDDAKRFFVRLPEARVNLERLYTYPDFSDMLELVPRDLLSRDYDGPMRSVADLEFALWHRLLQVANRQFYRSVSDFGAVASFVVIKRVELANLIRIIEGVRYGLRPQAIREGLIRVARAKAVG